MTFETVAAECPQSRTNRKTVARSEHFIGLSYRPSSRTAQPKRGIIPPLGEMTPNRRVTWQATSNDENS
jgi:hypothetical protein